MTESEGLNLQERVATLAQDIRRYAIIGIHHAGSGHPGGSLSAADVLAVLYSNQQDIAVIDPTNDDRDIFILSKGHACPALYGAWAARDFIPRYAVSTLRKLGSPLQGHPHVIELPLAETSTGSLGQGFSSAIGVALGLKHQNKSQHVFVMLGDGELQEGEVWEGAMSAAHHGLQNLCAIIDYNKLQSDDRNAAIMGLEPLQDKWTAFGWNAVEVDGHDLDQVSQALRKARTEQSKPTVMIAHTIKGRGVTYMEDQPTWHGSVKLSDDDTRRALTDLNLSQNDIEDWLNGTVH